MFDTKYEFVLYSGIVIVIIANGDIIDLNVNVSFDLLFILSYVLHSYLYH